MLPGNEAELDLLDFDDYVNRVRSANATFRLMVHPVYKVARELEAFQRFLATGERDPDFGSETVQRMRDRKASGRPSRRVYVIEPPLNDYQRFIFIGFHRYAEAGEDLRILDTSRTTNPGLPGYDFMLLNDDTVIKVHYGAEDGAWIGPELLRDADPAEYVRYRELALAHSVPFLEYEKTLDT